MGPIKSAAAATTDLTPVRAVRLSDEQLAIARQVRSGKRNLMVRARAGTGKTFLLLQCVTLMSGSIAIQAYNSKIAKEIRQKVGDAGRLRSDRSRTLDRPGVDVRTFSALGWQIVRKMLPSVRLEGMEDGNAGFYKFPRIADRLEIPQPLRALVHKAMQRAQERGFGILFPLNDAKQWLDLADHYALHTELPEDGSVLAQLLGIEDADWRDGLLKVCLRYAAKAIKLSLEMVKERFQVERSVGRGKQQKTVKSESFVGVISFTEQMYLPLMWNMVFPLYDWVLVDEAQDTNPLRREMARRMLKPGGRMLWVGDDRQAIYAWTGADSNALDIIAKQFNCIMLPMTVTFRCAKAIVRKAQTLVEDYRAANDNPEGEEYTITEEEFFKTDLVTTRENGTGDAIICRNTKPLIEIAYKLIAAGVPCHVEGREIGRGLISLLERWPHIKTFPALQDKLHEYRERETAHLLAKQQEMLADALTDKIETILAIMAGMPAGSMVAELIAKVNSLFADTNGTPAATVTLLTAHKSKGLEYTRVFVWGENKYMPASAATQDWQLEQEINLIYVAWTRAIFTLVSVVVANNNKPVLRRAA